MGRSTRNPFALGIRVGKQGPARRGGSSRVASLGEGQTELYFGVPTTTHQLVALITAIRQTIRTRSGCGGLSGMLNQCISRQVAAVIDDGAPSKPGARRNCGTLVARVDLANRRARRNFRLPCRICYARLQALAEGCSQAEAHGNPFAVRLSLAGQTRSSSTHWASPHHRIVERTIHHTGSNVVALRVVERRTLRRVPAAEGRICRVGHSLACLTGGNARTKISG